MMGKAKSCVGGFSIFNYVIDEKKGFELLRNGVCGETPVEIFQEFKIIQDQNQKATNKLFSLVLSPQIADGEKLSKKEFREIAKDYLEDLGFDTNQDQFIAFCHLEKKHRHIHFLLNRVSTDAKLKSDHFIGKKAQWAAHRVAEKHGLVSAKKMMVDKIREVEKSPAKIARKSIFEKHLAVMQHNPTTFKEYSNLMKNLGIELLPTINKKGQLQGLRVKDLGSGEEYKASDIHKSMGLKNILEAGLPLEGEVSLFPTLVDAQKNALAKSLEIQNQLESRRQISVEEEIESINNQT